MNPLGRSLQEAWGYLRRCLSIGKVACSVSAEISLCVHHQVRKPALRGEIGKEVRDLTREICRSLDIEIVKGHVRPDHVHLLLDVPPRLAPSRVMQRSRIIYCKITASCARSFGDHFGHGVLRGDDWECERYDGCRVYRNPRCRDPRRRFSLSSRLRAKRGL